MVSFFSSLKDSRLFQSFVIGIILFSSLLIGISTFEIEDRYLTILAWFDYAITSFFVFEITIRFIGDKEKSLLLKILEKASKDPHPIEYHALQLKRLVGIRHPDFLEFVVAVLYRLALVDLIVSKEEETDIRKVAHVFDIKKTFADKVMGFFDRRLTRINIFVKNIVDKLNAKSK